MADLGEQIDSLSANKVKSGRTSLTWSLTCAMPVVTWRTPSRARLSLTKLESCTKALADAENKDRSSLLTKFKMMMTDLENFREKLENENARKSDALKALSKAQAEIQLWKSRFETEGMGRVEELEAAR